MKRIGDKTHHFISSAKSFSIFSHASHLPCVKPCFQSSSNTPRNLRVPSLPYSSNILLANSSSSGVVEVKFGDHILLSFSSSSPSDSSKVVCLPKPSDSVVDGITVIWSGNEITSNSGVLYLFFFITNSFSFTL